MRGNGLDAHRISGGSIMPSQNTQWVACACANQALVTLSGNLAAYLAGTAKRPGEGRREAVDRLLGDLVRDYDFSLNWTDLDPTEYNVDEAQQIALEMVGDAIADIRKRALL